MTIGWRSRITMMMSIEFVFFSLLPLCFIFKFFLSFSEERGRYYPNGLRLDFFLFYLFPGYKLAYLLPPFTTTRNIVLTPSGDARLLRPRSVSSSWKLFLLLTMAGGLSGTVGLFQLINGLSRSGSWLVDAWAWFGAELAWAEAIPRCELCEVRDIDGWPIDGGTFGVGGDMCCPDRWWADDGCPEPKAEWWLAVRPPNPASPPWPISNGLNKYLVFCSHVELGLCGQSVFIRSSTETHFLTLQIINDYTLDGVCVIEGAARTGHALTVHDDEIVDG